MQKFALIKNNNIVSGLLNEFISLQVEDLRLHENLIYSMFFCDNYNLRALDVIFLRSDEIMFYCILCFRFSFFNERNNTVVPRFACVC